MKTNEQKLRDALQSLYTMTSRYAITDTDYGIVCNAASALAAPEAPDLSASPTAEKTGGLSPEHQRAVMESDRNVASDDYFKARTHLMDTAANRNIFEAGFQRGYKLLPTAVMAGSLSPSIGNVAEFKERVQKLIRARPLSEGNREYELVEFINTYVRGELAARPTAVGEGGLAVDSVALNLDAQLRAAVVQRTKLQHMLEIIALGDATDPAVYAEQALMSAGLLEAKGDRPDAMGGGSLWNITRLHDMGTVHDERGEFVMQTYYAAAKAAMDAHNKTVRPTTSGAVDRGATDEELGIRVDVHDAALEEAAKLCDKYDSAFTQTERLAAAIRALKSTARPTVTGACDMKGGAA